MSLSYYTQKELDKYHSVTPVKLINEDRVLIDTLTFSRNLLGVTVALIKAVKQVIVNIPDPLVVPIVDGVHEWDRRSCSMRLLVAPVFTGTLLPSVIVSKQEFDAAVDIIIGAYHKQYEPPNAWSVFVDRDKNHRFAKCIVYFCSNYTTRRVETVTIPVSNYKRMMEKEFKYRNINVWSRKNDMKMFCEYHQLQIKVEKDLVHVLQWTRPGERSRFHERHSVTVTLVRKSTDEAMYHETVIGNKKRITTANAYRRLYAMLAKQGAFDWIRFVQDTGV